MKFKIALLSIFLAVVSGTGTVAALSPAPNIGQHLHFDVTNHPVDGHPIPQAPYTFHLVFKEHDQTGATAYFRLDNSSTAGPQIAVHLGPCVDCTLLFDYTVDFSKWSAGRHELRWHLDVPKNNDGNRQFTTSRAQVCIVVCTPNSVDGRPTPFNGGGSWYLGHYATVYDLSRDTSIRPGGSVTFRAAQNATRSCAFLNPDFHHGSSGTPLGCFAGTGSHTVAIPATALVGDKLVLYADEANGNAGLIRLILGDGTDKAFADYEFQSWWAKGGVVFPG